MTRWLDPKKAALTAGVSVPTIRRAIKAGALRFHRLQPGGRLLRIAEADLQAWLTADRPAAEEAAS
jgi:excisionase family DNA binding protein